MDDEKVKVAQEILEWAIGHLKGSIQCKVIDYKHKDYRIQFFTKDNKLIMSVQISEEEIEGTKPDENSIHDKLKLLIRNLDSYG